MAKYSLSSAEVEQIWQQCCHQIQLQVSSAVFNTWILSNPVTIIELEGDDQAFCTITSPTAFHSQNIKKSLSNIIIETLKAVIGRNVELTFVIGTPKRAAAPEPAETANHYSHAHSQNNAQNNFYPSDTSSVNNHQQSTSPEYYPSDSNSADQNDNLNQTQSFADYSAPALYQQNQPQYNNNNNSGQQSPTVDQLFSAENVASARLDRVKVAAQQAGLRPDYTFESFAVSTTNEMAHAAATAVSQRPGVAYNPLFFYGGVGVGKTHLMHALAHNILKTNPTAKIIYCTSEEFTNEIVSAIQNKKALKFKDKYRKAQVLLIDDIQFIAGKNSVQEEFFHTFNALTQQARQIVITSDRPPHEINLLEDRLKSRFEAGLMVDIQQPSFELRTAILLIKSKAQSLPLPMDLAQQIAAKVDSARRIEGLIKRIKSAVEPQGKKLDSTLIDNLLRSESNGIEQKQIRVAPGDVIRAVANHYHLKQAAVKGKSRVSSLVKARHIAMFILKAELHLPLTEIGRWFSDRDHTSVLHATRKIEEDLDTNASLQQEVSALKMSLSAISK